MHALRPGLQVSSADDGAGGAFAAIPIMVSTLDSPGSHGEDYVIQDGVIWQPALTGRTRLKMWDDDDTGVLYDVVSGDTHVLDPLAMEVLRLLFDRASGIVDLCRQLQALSPELDRARLPLLVSRVLARLHTHGLISSHPN
jgi:PqqD family protein of HPr-rel-A system